MYSTIYAANTPSNLSKETTPFQLEQTARRNQENDYSVTTSLLNGATPTHLVTTNSVLCHHSHVGPLKILLIGCQNAMHINIYHISTYINYIKGFEVFTH